MKLLFLICILFFFTDTYGQKTLRDDSLTIDKDLQELGARLLSNKQGSIVAIDPTNGEIKCLVSMSFINDDINRAIAKEYSPGSTLKVAQALTYLSEDIISKDSKYSCAEGFWQKNIHIGCHKHYSPLSIVGAISNSCNSYFCKAFVDLVNSRKCYPDKNSAIDAWHEYMTSMGLGTKLGIDIPGEITGVMPDSRYLNMFHKQKWNAQTIMWIGIGQGEVTATPLQLCNLAASVANKGYYYVPHIHKGTSKRPLPSRYAKRNYTIATQKAYDIVTRGMRGAIVSGTAKSQNTNEFVMYGKTGTSENIGNDHSLFIGFSSLGNKHIAVSVVIENGGFGADLAAPLASLIIEQYLKGKLSARSENKARQWEDFTVLPSEMPDDFEETGDEG